MAIVESKSLSNTEDLISLPGDPGQHLWDYVRLKTNGLELPAPRDKPLKWRPDMIEAEPTPFGKKPRAGAFETQLIGVTPKDFTKSQVDKLSYAGDNIVRWPWPVDEDEVDRFVREAKKVLRDAGG